MFQQDQRGFFRRLESEEAHEGEMPEMEKFVEFWGGIWERERERERERGKNPIYAMDGRDKNAIDEKVSQVNEFNITFEKVKKEVAKRKGWTASSIDGIQNYWWKKLGPAQKALTRAFTKIKEDNSNIPIW